MILYCYCFFGYVSLIVLEKLIWWLPIKVNLSGNPTVDINLCGERFCFYTIYIGYMIHDDDARGHLWNWNPFVLGSHRIQNVTSVFLSCIIFFNKLEKWGLIYCRRYTCFCLNIVFEVMTIPFEEGTYTDYSTLCSQHTTLYSGLWYSTCISVRY